MATRLQADADGKEAKWADIDDDEDDWAPETIEWNDGTKITLPQNDPVADVAEEQSTSQTEKARYDEDNKRGTSTPKATNIVGPNATVLRLGAKAPPKSGGVVLKTPSEKPSLVVKPAAPPPAKSPWASLPPVDKVAPITVNPPTQAQPMQYQRQESFSKHAEPAPPTPAMEIAADSFSRTPRDSINAGQGQLYNSQSGQYETVSSHRRGSNKRDQNFRPPSLLQRPTPSNRQAPSQSNTEISLLSRRTSIGGAEMQVPSRSESASKNDVRFGEIHDPAGSSQTEPSSQAVGPPETSSMQSQSASTYGSGTPRPYSFRRPGSIADGSNHVNSPGAAGLSMSPMANEVNVQRQLMQESIEKARQRKQEEIQREEAAREERIRKKLEALGPLASKEPEPKAKTTEMKGSSSEAKEEVPSKLSPKPSTAIPSSQAELPNGKPAKVNALSGPSKIGSQNLANGVSPGERGKEVVLNPHSTPIQSPKLDRGKASENHPMVNGVLNRGLDGESASEILDNGVDPSQRANKQQQPWNTEGEAFNGWKTSGTSTHPSPVNSLWGPPMHHKGIGNGAFDQKMHRQALRQSPFQDRQPSPALQPIGPPRAGQQVPDVEEYSRQPPNARETLNGLPPQPTSISPTYHLQPIDNHLSGQARAYGAKQPQIHPNASISPLNNNQKASLIAWDDFKTNTSTIEREQARQASQKFAALTAEEQKRFDQLPEISETWRLTQSNGPGQRSVVSVHKDQISQANVLKSGHPEISIQGQFPQMASMPVTGRTSRFMTFMENSYPMPMQQLGVIPVDAPRSPSPPPPETIVHPAFDRLHGLPRPRVNLPGVVPQGAASENPRLDVLDFSLESPTEKPRVRLPPVNAAAPGLNATSMPPLNSDFTDARAVPLRAVSQPLVNNKAWQDRFNGLLGTSSKKLSPEKPMSSKLHVPSPQAITSTSKDPLEISLSQVSAAVSIPVKDDESSDTEASIESSSKPMEDEEALFENREFGSLPTVNLAPVDTTWKQARSSKNRKVNRTPAKEVTPSSKDMFDHPGSTVPGGFLIFINFKGMMTPKSKILRFPGLQGGVPHDPRQRSFSLNHKSGKGLKMRETSGNYQQRPPPTGQPQMSAQNAETSPHASSRGLFNKRHGHGQSHGHATWNTSHRVASAAH